MGTEWFAAGPLHAAARALKRLGRAGQVTIELLLVLPVFMLLLFLIMQMGTLAWNTILAHHCAYEMARIGSLVAGPTGAQTKGGIAAANIKMKNVMNKMFPTSQGVRVEGVLVPTLMDPQSYQQGEDLLVTLTYPVKLVFPGANFILSDPPRTRRTKTIVVKVRMPVEKPYFK